MLRYFAAALAALVITVVATGFGFARATPEEGPRWTAEDSAALDGAVEALEERLLTVQARVRFWEELRERHEGVTAVACENLGAHAIAMANNEARYQARAAEQRRRRVAAAALDLPAVR